MSLSRASGRLSVWCYNTPLFNNAIEHNIRSGRIEASEEEVRKACTEGEAVTCGVPDSGGRARHGDLEKERFAWNPKKASTAVPRRLPNLGY